MTLNITCATVRLTLRFNKTILATGSGFLYKRNNSHYLVTAWHNLSGRHSITLKPLHKEAALPNNMIVDMPQAIYFPPIGTQMFAHLPIRLDFDDGANTTYFVHKQSWPRVDVAVLPFDPKDKFLHEVYLSTGETREYSDSLSLQQPDGTKKDIVVLVDDNLPKSLPSGSIAPEQIVHTVGDDLFLLGFPAGITDQNISPIWKRATIATDLTLGWNKQKQFLVDSASRKGMSGGPAIYYNKHGNIPVQPGSSISIGKPIHILHGVYVGRLGDSEFEAQVGVVWKKEMVDEIIDDGRPAISTHEIECSSSDIEEKIKQSWPSEADPDMYLEEKPALGYLTFHIMESLDGRCNPYDVADRIKIFAKKKKTTT